MLAVMNLQWKAYWKGPGPFFTFGFSILLIAVFGSVQPLQSLVPAMVGLNIANISMFSFGNNFMELKNSTIVKRMGSTPITKSEFILGLLIFNILLILVSIFWLMLIAYALSFIPNFLQTDSNYLVSGAFTFDSDTNAIKVVDENNFKQISANEFKVLNSAGHLVAGETITTFDILDPDAINPFAQFTYSNIQWGYFLYAILESLLMGMAIAFFFTTITKTVQSFGLVTSIYTFIFVSMLGGVFIPITSIQDSWLFYLAFLSPVSYGNTLLLSAFYGGVGTEVLVNGSNWMLNYELGNAVAAQQTMSWFMPWIFAGGAFAGSVKLFNWEG